MKFSPVFYMWTLLFLLITGCSEDENLTAVSKSSTLNEVSLNSEAAQGQNNVSTGDTEGFLQVHFIDAGQGDAALFQADNTVILVHDDYTGQYDVISYLKEYGIKKIDLLVGPSPSGESIDQFSAVISEFAVEEIWMSGGVSNSRAFEQTVDVIMSSDLNYYEPRAGEHFDFGSLKVEVIHPESISGDMISDSLSIRVSYGNFSFLLTGDIAPGGENEILNRGLDLNAQVFIPGRHDSSAQDAAELLKEINPEIAIYNSQEENTSPEVLDALEKEGIPVYETNIHGSLIVKTDGFNEFIIEDSQ
ncbi:MBL fold metallo-hydrolase [Evansella sp. LMS18]|uniref:ComEC/Rec2 family competence protein n=1 Tax=Evansella sp. LMS18 TaxID=2924033 RepID=UPI0020D1212F|nr:MBL fold metallo-hydrolase [Evansella sp. LMS18]UTR09699.1 MBL fold metallo-hydrolase [Evansella sp. LMS18]